MAVPHQNRLIYFHMIQVKRRIPCIVDGTRCGPWLAMSAEAREKRCRLVAELKEYCVMDQDACGRLGLNVSVENGFKLSDAACAYDSGTLEWMSLGSCPEPLESMFHWLSEDVNFFFVDKCVQVWESVYYFVAEVNYSVALKFVSVLVFNVYDQQSQIILFR